MFRTLLVEDNQNFREFFKQELSGSFPTIIIEEAGDAKEAMERVHSCCPDLVFMDIGLPGESGFKLTERIKAKWPNVNIIMLTSYDSPEYREAAVQCGASHYLVKGFVSSAEIEALVKSFLNCSQNSAILATE
jgi:DNA-binding NarL/FixJ family response regulator